MGDESNYAWLRVHADLLHNSGMASIPAGALILTLEEALRYFPQWTPSDRTTALEWVEATGVTEFYVPPSGGYVGCHGGPNRSAFRDIAVNGLEMHVGFLLAWPNYAAVKRIELSHSRGSGSVITTRGRIADDAETKLCRQCNLVVPRQLDECDNCGYDFDLT